MTLGMLQENEVDCHLKDENIITIDPLLSPAVGGIKLMVEDRDLERAKGLIREAEAAYIRDIPCPNCQVHALIAEEKTSLPAGFWGKLKNQIAYGQTSTYQKIYKCEHCRSIFTELPVNY